MLHNPFTNIPDEVETSDFLSAEYLVSLSPCFRHIGYVYPSDLDKIPAGKRVKVTVEYEDDLDEHVQKEGYNEFYSQRSE